MDRPIVRILVVDDCAPFRHFLCTTLQARPDLQVVGQASDGLQAVQSAEELQPDVIFLDIGMPKLNGIEAAPPNIATCSRRKNPLYQSREQRRGNRGSSKGWSKGIHS